MVENEQLLMPGSAEHLRSYRFGAPSGNKPGRSGHRGPQPKAGYAVARAKCRKIIEDPQYEKQLRDRALAGELPPALEIMLHHYAYGKPVERIEILDEPDEDYTGLTVEQLRERVEVLRLAAASANPDGSHMEAAIDVESTVISDDPQMDTAIDVDPTVDSSEPTLVPSEPTS